MAKLLTAQQILDRSRAAGVSMSRLCRHADVSGGAFARWLKGDGAGVSTNTYDRLMKALEDAERAAWCVPKQQGR